jgi:hypothetical protein
MCGTFRIRSSEPERASESLDAALNTLYVGSAVPSALHAPLAQDHRRQRANRVRAALSSTWSCMGADELDHYRERDSSYVACNPGAFGFRC